MCTIKLPNNCSLNDILYAFRTAANADREGYPNIANRLSEQADALAQADEMPDRDEGAVCHCDQRDPDEIAVYFKADELMAALWALGRITFGDLPDHVDVRHVHGAYTEIEAVALDRLTF